MASRGRRVKDMGADNRDFKTDGSTQEAKPELEYSAVASWLVTKYTEFMTARKPQEAVFLDAYQDYMCIPRRGDTKSASGGVSGSIGLPTTKAESIFLRWSRNKVRSATAMTNNVLFGSGKDIPFDVEPTDEQWQPLADALKEILEWQLLDGDWIEAAKDAKTEGVIYGTGQMAGPYVRTAKHERAVPHPKTGAPVPLSISYPQPYFRAPLTMDYYPDPNATANEPGLGGFEVLYYSPDVVLGWKQEQGYFNVEQAATKVVAARKAEGSDLARNVHANVNPSVEGKVGVAWYTGLVPSEKVADYLEKMKMTDLLEQDFVVARIGMAIDLVVFLSVSPIQKKIDRWYFEKTNGEAYGVGVVENNAMSLKLANAGARLFTVGKGMALNPPRSIDKSLFKASEDFRYGPGKVWELKPNLSVEQRRDAVIVHEMDDVSEGWKDFIAWAEQMSDDDTAVRKVSMGEGEQDLTRTAHGISMILNAASLPMKEVLANFDKQIIEPSIQGLIEWDMKYLEPELVGLVLGPDTAQKWAQIQKIGKVEPVMKWRATGAATFVAKEVLLQKIQGFISLAGSNPALMSLVDMRDLLEITWESMETGKQNPVKDAKTVQQLNAAMQQKQAEQEQIQRAVIAGKHAVDVSKAMDGQAHADLEKERVLHDRVRLHLDAADMFHTHATEHMDALEAPPNTPMDTAQ